MKQAVLDDVGYTPDFVRCKHAMKYGPGRTNMPHSDQFRVRIAEALRGTDAGRRRLEEFERRTNQKVANEIQRDENMVRMDAPAALGEMVGDGQAAASSAPAPSPFSDLPSHAEPRTVTAAGSHHRPRGSRSSQEQEHLGHDEEAQQDTQGAMPPEG